MQRKASFCICTEEFCRCLLLILPTSLLPCTDIVSRSHGASKPGEHSQKRASFITLQSLCWLRQDVPSSPRHCQYLSNFLQPTAEAVLFSMLQKVQEDLSLFCHMRRKQGKAIGFFFIFNMYSKFQSLWKIIFETEKMQASFMTWQPYILSKWPQHYKEKYVWLRDLFKQTVCSVCKMWLLSCSLQRII